MAGVGGVRDTVVGDLVPGGVLRAAINLGNPVLAQGLAAAPAGVTVDIARELGARLGVEVDLACFTAARESLAAMARGDADICFLAIEPARAAEVAFTTPYVVIEGVFVVPVEPAITRSPMPTGPACASALTRGQLTTCSCPGPCGRPAWCAAGTGSGCSASRAWTLARASAQVVSGFVAGNPGVRMIGEPFMQIRQAQGTSRTRDPGTIRFLTAFIEDLKASGFIRDVLRCSGQDSALAAPPQPPA